jgi:predicted small lipoprotein YifL
MSVQSRCKTALAIALIGLALAGCGRRGSLDLPSSAGAEPQSPPTAQADSGQGKPQGEAAKPHKATILDGLLR